MARVTGKATKKRRKRRNPPRAKKKPVAGRRRFKAAFDASLRTPSHIVLVAPSALADPVGADVIRRRLPAYDPALLPEFLVVLLAAIDRFKIRRDSACYPSKETLINFFRSARLSDGSRLSYYLADAAATFVRPPDAMKGGRPPTRQTVSGVEQAVKRFNPLTVSTEKD